MSNLPSTWTCKVRNRYILQSISNRGGGVEEKGEGEREWGRGKRPTGGAGVDFTPASKTTALRPCGRLVHHQAAISVFHYASTVLVRLVHHEAPSLSFIIHAQSWGKVLDARGNNYNSLKRSTKRTKTKRQMCVRRLIQLHRSQFFCFFVVFFWYYDFIQKRIIWTDYQQLWFDSS